VNLILFENHELGRALPRRDERTIHLIKTLHKKAGDFFDAGILGGQRGKGIIEKINLDGSLSVSLRLNETPPPRFPIRLAAGFSRPIQLRRIFRDISNLGAAAIDLMGTELGEKSYRDTTLFNRGGSRAALIEGAIQARDTSVPLLSVFDSVEQWLRERPWEPENRPGAPGPLLIAADNVRPEGAIASLSPTMRPFVIAVGCERGWSDRERDMLEAAGFLRLSLGDRALRTETACVAAIVLAMEKTGAL
jgi:RsmE family RNA methyltransferase